MELSALTDLITKELEENKASDIQSIDITEKTTIADCLIICTGRSTRHVKAIASKLIEHFKHLNHPPLSQSGLEQSEWALIDFGDVIVHIMLAEARAFYNIEGLWSDIEEALPSKVLNNQQ